MADSDPQHAKLHEDGSSYALLARRLATQGQQLERLTASLNTLREQTFGATSMVLLGRGRVRTELKSIARDAVRIGDQMLFGFHVQLGLKRALRVEDVFRLYRVDDQEDAFSVAELGVSESFLTDERFNTDFQELQQYYSHATLSQLVILKGMLLMDFQIGEKLEDRRVFRWELDALGNVSRYIDNRGDRDLSLPDRFDFAWRRVSRDDHVQGRSPHINIADTLFVDNLGGSVTFKVENNTDSGEGIYTDAVESDSQSLDDASVEYADLGELLLVRIRPFAEKVMRYYAFHRPTRGIQRCDAMDSGIVLLPDNHGLMFASGYLLSNGQLKTFDVPAEPMRLLRSVRSPNGEDVLYHFYAGSSGRVVFYRYNLVTKQADAPLLGHGAALFDNGHLVLFNAEREPSLVHPLQIWITPFLSDIQHARHAADNDSQLGRIGNAELVRGLAELNDLAGLVRGLQPYDAYLAQLIKGCDRLLEQYYWIDEIPLPGEDGETDVQHLPAQIQCIRETAETIGDEFEKVEEIRRQSAEAVTRASAQLSTLKRGITPDSWHHPEPFLRQLKAVRQFRGDVRTLAQRRYVDVEAVDSMDQTVAEIEQRLIDRTLAFLATPDALQGYCDSLAALVDRSQQATACQALADCVADYREIAEGLDLVQAMLATLGGKNPELEVNVNQMLATVFASLNRERTSAERRLEELTVVEQKARFGARLRLFEQSLASGIAAISAPDDATELLTRMLDLLQELEAEFGEQAAFLTSIVQQREHCQEAIETKREQLAQQRRGRVMAMSQAAERILDGVPRRAERFEEEAALQAFLAADPMIEKVIDSVASLRELGATMEADDLEARLVAVRDAALRSVRDRADLFEDGGQVIRLGPRHRFSVNRQEVSLTLVPRDDQLTLHITGTQFYEALTCAELQALSPLWTQHLPSESPQVYRGEYLAYRYLQHVDAVVDTADMDALEASVRQFAAPRFREGYEQGVHDHDAARIIAVLEPARRQAGLLRFSPLARAVGLHYWLGLPTAEAQELIAHCVGAGQILREYGSDELKRDLVAELAPLLSTYELVVALGAEERCHEAATYLVEWLAADQQGIEVSQHADRLANAFREALDRGQQRAAFEAMRQALTRRAEDRWMATRRWLSAWSHAAGIDELERYYLDEVVAMIDAGDQLSWTPREAELSVPVEGLLGDHGLIESRRLMLRLDDFEHRLEHHLARVEPAWEQLQDLRKSVLEEQGRRLDVTAFRPRPLTSFVRNRLISESYLPLIGDNMAKQLGTVGAKRRSDLMGLLMLISPPGYGKTTLMEYVAHRLGLIFMKINCPSLGREVTSLDPQKAPHATARAELEKVNLALEMGNNVMLYLDDIQHTDPEFLQKFISLSDATRTIDGVWRGTTRTYQLRGKRFCIVMAGNPYTEEGKAFRVPDMLANRADIYNLGDILSGTATIFAQSYIENSLSAHPVLAPLLTRGMEDVYRFIDMAAGREVPVSELEHDYSGAERDEIVALLTRMQRIRDVILKVNGAYIASSAQADSYREEPPFLLQGSYRNMAKLVEKLSPAMTDGDIDALIDDHYQGEAQLLTSGAEENLLKLRALRGTMDPDDAARWASVCAEYRRRQQAGGDEDVGAKVVMQLGRIAEGLGQGVSSRQRDRDSQLCDRT
ncbi:DNA repair ATPase [Halomonas denitrificans]|uniref:DNA repair ATPase n=1 Tax=Halomonas denitrificans TaxID=370769 RepID=UPI001C998519|nr:DNA repair ATPase [Halomonas denitrificans]MBY5970138.1 DNA repair ATPase [Halomonas denitrificans]